MKPLPNLIDSTGKAIRPGQHIADGGEGSVYGLANDANSVVKIYFDHSRPDALKLEKLNAMVELNNPRLQAISAWPTGLVFHATNRQVLGFVMPNVSDGKWIQRLYNPAERMKFFPQAGWNFQIRAAQNLAAAFDEVHKADCLVGDVNEQNAFVTPQALVRLIDCDSFQIRSKGKQYLCEVGKPHYTAPELQGKSYRGLIRTENHDRFGLAVLIYQLLFVGRPPYSGQYSGSEDLNFAEMIAQYRFGQGPMAHTWKMAPPRNTPTFHDIPLDLGLLFRKAFEKGSENGTRPKPTDWIPVLKALEQASVECPTDSGHKYWKGANSCVWCRLAANGGPEYYYGAGLEGGTFAVDDSKLLEIQRRLAAANADDLQYDRHAFRDTRVYSPKPLPSNIAILVDQLDSTVEKHLLEAVSWKDDLSRLINRARYMQTLAENAASELKYAELAKHQMEIDRLETTTWKEDLTRAIDHARQKRISVETAALEGKDAEVAKHQMEIDTIAKHLAEIKAKHASESEVWNEQRRVQLLEAQFKNIAVTESLERGYKKKRVALDRQLHDELHEINEQFLDSLAQASAVTREGHRITAILISTTCLGLVLCLFGFVRSYLGVIGGIITLVFGSWVVIRRIMASRALSQSEIRAIHRQLLHETKASCTAALSEAKSRHLREHEKSTIKFNNELGRISASFDEVTRRSEQKILRVEQQLKGTLKLSTAVYDDECLIAAKVFDAECFSASSIHDGFMQQTEAKILEVKRASELATARCQDECLVASQAFEEACRRASAIHDGLVQQAEVKVLEIKQQLRNASSSENESRQSRFRQAETAVIVLETTWADRVQEFRKKYSAHSSGVSTRTAACLNLVTQYQAELRRLTANAESQACLRHLRLNQIADADISNLGTNRKQLLANYGLYTAADVDLNAILAIKGFGEFLATKLMEWRQQVLREFQFDPKSGISPADLLIVALRYRNQQKQILSELERGVADIESSKSTCRSEIERLKKKLISAVSERGQAREDALALKV